MNSSLKNYKFEILFAVLVAARATSFVFNKILLGHIGVMSLLALRFLAAAVILVILFPKKITVINKESLKGGTAIGVAFFLVMVTELMATRTADTSLVSTVQHVSVILVPIMNAVITRKMFGMNTAVGAVLAFLGILCFGLKGGSFRGSIWMSLIAAFMYATVVILTDKLTTPETDPITVGMVQLLTMGILATVFALFTEKITLPSGPSEWAMFVYLVVICTCFGYTLTPYAQSHISVDRAGIICAVNPAVAAVMGVLILGEDMGLLGTIGLLLVLSSMLLPYIRLQKND